ncbi:MAG: GIY-YIG nuclease family protein [Proteobacteria bacterium]|nr:GIY-YIG nuclease family protein [Pseudomonadota bacterium]
MSCWYVYLVRCADDSLYTGITIDIDRRIAEHNHNNRLAASYTCARRPVSLVYQETCLSRSAAVKREYVIKQMSKQEKEILVKQ